MDGIFPGTLVVNQGGVPLLGRVEKLLLTERMYSVRWGNGDVTEELPGDVTPVEEADTAWLARAVAAAAAQAVGL